MIRRASAEDVALLSAVERAASGAGLAHVFGDIPFPLDDVLARWALVLADPSATTLLDERDGTPVGYASYGDGWLRHLGVLPEHWGTGRAQALHAHVLAQSTAAGSPTTYLWVLVDNDRARSFYRRLGWRETDVVEQETFAPFPFKTQMTRSADEEGRAPWISP